MGLDTIAGYRTYIVAVALILHQVLKLSGIDIAEENISNAIDVVLGIGVLVFRKLAKKPATTTNSQQ